MIIFFLKLDFGYILLSHWPKGSHCPLATSQVTENAGGYYPQPNSKTMLLKIPHIYIVKHGEI